MCPLRSCWSEFSGTLLWSYQCCPPKKVPPLLPLALSKTALPVSSGVRYNCVNCFGQCNVTRRDLYHSQIELLRICAWFVTFALPCLSELGNLDLDGSPISLVLEWPLWTDTPADPHWMCSVSEKDVFFGLSHWDVVYYHRTQPSVSETIPLGKKWRMFFINPVMFAEPTASQQEGHIPKQSACFHLSSVSPRPLTSDKQFLLYPPRGRIILFGRWLKLVLVGIWPANPAYGTGSMST